MAATRTVTRTLVVRTEADGAAQTATDLNKVGGAAQQAGEKIRTFERTLGATGATVKETSGRMLSVEKGYDRLRKSIDPVYRETQRLAAAETLLSKARMQGLDGIEETNRLLSLQRERFSSMGKDALAANTNIKLTSGQMQGLGYQINDVGTMLAMGASPFQVLTSQAGQVVQVLGDGPQGMSGSLKAIGSGIGRMLVQFGPVIGVVGALGLAVGTYFSKIAGGFPDADATLKKHGDALRAIEERYGSLSDRVKNLGVSGTGANILAGAALRDLEKLQKAQAAVMEQQLTGSASFWDKIGVAGAENGGQQLTAGQLPTLPQFAPIRKEVDALRATIAEGGNGIAAFQLRLAEMYRTAGDDLEMQKAIEAAAEFGDTLSATAANSEQLKRAMLESSGAYRRMASDAGQYKDAMSELAAFTPDTRTDRTKIDQSYAVAVSKAKTEAEVGRAEALRLSGLKQIERAEQAIRAGHQLDMQSVTARTASEKADIAEERAKTRELQL